MKAVEVQVQAAEGPPLPLHGCHFSVWLLKSRVETTIENFLGQFLEIEPNSNISMSLQGLGSQVPQCSQLVELHGPQCNQVPQPSQPPASKLTQQSRLLYATTQVSSKMQRAAFQYFSCDPYA